MQIPMPQNGERVWPVTETRQPWPAIKIAAATLVPSFTRNDLALIVIGKSELSTGFKGFLPGTEQILEFLTLKSDIAYNFVYQGTQRKETTLTYPFRQGELRVPFYLREYMKRSSTLLCLSVALLGTAASQSRQSTPAQSVQALIERYSADHDSLASVYTDELSPVARERMNDFDAQWRKQLASVNFPPLDQEGKADYVLFANHLDREDHQRAIEAEQWKEVVPLIPFASSIFALEESRRRIDAPNGEYLARKLNLISVAITTLRRELETSQNPSAAASSLSAKNQPITRPTRIAAWRAAEDVEQMRKQLQKWFEFYNGYDPSFTWWAAQPYEQTDKAMKNYAGFLREKMAGIASDDKSTIIGTPVGRAALMAQLSDEMIPYTPEELIAMAKEQMAWCQQEMIRASREMGYGDNWHKALEKVKTMYVEPGKQPQLIRDLAIEGADFAEKNNLVTIPALARETWRMDMMSPERQLVNPFFTGGDTISVSYPTDTMTFDQRMMSMRGNNIEFARATVFHELIPGHWLQQFMTARYRPYRQPFFTGFWVEGNAFYWETLFWDRGFDQTPEQRVGALFWRMHRCARIIFSLSFHLGIMSPEQAIDLLVNEVGHEHDNAVAEVRRSFNGNDGPLYQCAYMLGAMQFRALHHELVDSKKMSDREFHDTILKENMMPVAVLRAILTNQDLSPNFKSNWRFLDR